MNKMPASEPARCLRKARDLLNHDTWTQGVMARRKDGRMVGPTSPDAVKWSAEGMIRNLCGDSIGTAILSIIAVEITLEGLDNKKWRLDVWNDVPGRTVGEVQQILNLSAKRLMTRDEILRRKNIY